MKRLTGKQIKEYLTKNYGVVRHDCEKLKEAAITISKRYGCSSLDIFHFIVDDSPINSLYTHSYGFHTQTGRNIHREFINKYNTI